MITICQCNINDGGRWTNRDQTRVTYDTARRFAEFTASVNPIGSPYPPISIVGMQEVPSETDRAAIEDHLRLQTDAPWQSARTPQGIDGASGIGLFWRTDLVESLPEWDLGEVTLDRLDNGYEIKFIGRLFASNAGERIVMVTGKLAWSDAVITGRGITEEDRRLEAAKLKSWVEAQLSRVQGTMLVIATDLNSGAGTSTWKEMNADYCDPSSQHTHNSFLGPALMYLLGKRLDYLWLKRGTGAFVDGPHASPHFGSDHRAVYATFVATKLP